MHSIIFTFFSLIYCRSKETFKKTMSIALQLWAYHFSIQAYWVAAGHSLLLWTTFNSLQLSWLIVWAVLVAMATVPSLSLSLESVFDHRALTPTDSERMFVSTIISYHPTYVRYLHVSFLQSCLKYEYHFYHCYSVS